MALDFWYGVQTFEEPEGLSLAWAACHIVWYLKNEPDRDWPFGKADKTPMFRLIDRRKFCKNCPAQDELFYRRSLRTAEMLHHILTSYKYSFKEA